MATAGLRQEDDHCHFLHLTVSVGEGARLVVQNILTLATWRRAYFDRRTQRALDGGESARLTSIFLASGLYCAQALSTTTPPPVTQTVGTLIMK